MKQKTSQIFDDVNKQDPLRKLAIKEAQSRTRRGCKTSPWYGQTRHVHQKSNDGASTRLNSSFSLSFSILLTSTTLECLVGCLESLEVNRAIKAICCAIKNHINLELYQNLIINFAQIWSTKKSTNLPPNFPKPPQIFPQRLCKFICTELHLCYWISTATCKCKIFSHLASQF